MTHINGDTGIYLFPITNRVAYVIRDNGPIYQPHNHRFDLFVVIGDNPSHVEFKHCRYIESVTSYELACIIIEQNMARGEALRTAHIS